MKLVIRGAYYYDDESDLVLQPVFTGEFNAVDCVKHYTLDKLLEIYDDDFTAEALQNPITFNNSSYYPGETEVLFIGDWLLLSDLSELTHNEELFNFKITY